MKLPVTTDPRYHDAVIFDLDCPASGRDTAEHHLVPVQRPKTLST
jgi:hypothetical protein